MLIDGRVEKATKDPDITFIQREDIHTFGLDLMKQCLLDNNNTQDHESLKPDKT